MHESRPPAEAMQEMTDWKHVRQLQVNNTQLPVQYTAPSAEYSYCEAYSHRAASTYRATYSHRLNHHDITFGCSQTQLEHKDKEINALTTENRR